MSKLNFFQNKPKLARIDARLYLDRIGMKKEEPSLAYLRKLHRAHLLNIPFENLDIHYQKKIVLDYEKIFEKVVIGKRGGYCYELNGLFCHLLTQLGFECQLISGQVKNERSGEFGPEFDHMAIILHLEGTMYLADVGFGKGCIYPKAIVPHQVQMDYTNYWRLTQDPDENYLLQVSEDASVFHTKYRFSTNPKEIIQFMEMNEYHQSSLESPFTQQKLITRLTESGRVTLTSRSFIQLELGEKKEVELVNEDEFLAKLEQHFGILPAQLCANKY